MASAKENWAKLSDDDLQQTSGNREQLAAKIQETYGITRRQAEKASMGLGQERGAYSEDHCITIATKSVDKRVA